MIRAPWEPAKTRRWRDLGAFAFGLMAAISGANRVADVDGLFRVVLALGILEMKGRFFGQNG